MSVPRPVERALVSLILGSALGAAASIVLTGLAVVAGEPVPFGGTSQPAAPEAHEFKLIHYPPALPVLTAHASGDRSRLHADRLEDQP